MRPNWRSSGVATADAIVSGLAPGSPATTEIVGKSTCGSGATGRRRKLSAPAMQRAIVISVVPTGRRTNGAEMLMAPSPDARPETQQARLLDRLTRGLALRALRVEREVDHHDRVLHHDADEENDTDQRNDRELEAHDEERQQRAEACRRERRQDRDGVDPALV